MARIPSLEMGDEVEMEKRKIVLILVCLMFVAWPCWGAEYYIDNTDKAVSEGETKSLEVGTSLEPATNYDKIQDKILPEDTVKYKASNTPYMGNLKGNGPPVKLGITIVAESGVRWTASNAWLPGDEWELVNEKTQIYKHIYDRDDIDTLDIRLIGNEKDLNKNFIILTKVDGIIDKLIEWVTGEKSLNLNEWCFDKGSQMIYLNIGRQPVGKEIRPWSKN